MPHDGPPHGEPSPLAVVLALTTVAGFLDAFSLSALTGTFIANQTGNTVLIGVAIADGALSDLWPPLVATGAFVAGALASRLLVGSAELPRRRVRLLAVETVLVAVYLVAALASVGMSAVRATGGSLLVLVFLSSAAMGVQTAVVTHARGAGVSTTFTSGMLAEIGHLVGSLSAVRPGERRTPELRASIVGSAIVTYIAGAALGGLGAQHGTLWLAGSLVVLVVLLVEEWFAARPRSTGGRETTPAATR